MQLPSRLVVEMVNGSKIVEDITWHEIINGCLNYRKRKDTKTRFCIPLSQIVIFSVTGIGTENRPDPGPMEL